MQKPLYVVKFKRSGEYWAGGSHKTTPNLWTAKIFTSLKILKNAIEHYQENYWTAESEYEIKEVIIQLKDEMSL